MRIRTASTELFKRSEASNDEHHPSGDESELSLEEFKLRKCQGMKVVLEMPRWRRPQADSGVGGRDDRPIPIEAASILKMQLAQNVGYVEFCGPLRDAQRAGNVLICQTP